MTENSHPIPESEDSDHVSNLAGHDTVTGPAAFKAQQKASTEESSEDTIEAKVTGLEAALAESNDKLLRTVAEMENLRKRFVREREDAGKYAVTSFARDLLDVSDTFRRAIDSIPADLREDERVNGLVSGIEAMERALLSCFEKNGIRKIEPLDEIFNPNFHEVMFEAPMPGKPSGTIIQLIEPGYLISDRLLRPARVGVVKSTDDTSESHSVDTQA